MTRLLAPMIQPGYVKFARMNWNLMKANNNNLLTEAEAICYLRLDALGIKNPVNSLRNYREKGELRGTYICNRLLYSLKALDEFIERRTRKE